MDKKVILLTGASPWKAGDLQELVAVLAIRRLRI